MPLVSLRQLLDRAAEPHYGLPAFINNMEQNPPLDDRRDAQAYG